MSMPGVLAEKAVSDVPQFVDVTRELGIDFRQISGRADQKDYIFEAKGGGVGFFDYDRDGWQDLFLVQGGTIEASRDGDCYKGRLYRNEKGRRFTDVTEEAGVVCRDWGMGVTFGDIDNDGWTDIYLTALGENTLLHNEGDGTFEDWTERAGVGAPGWSTSAAFGDYDGDGDLDLYVAGYLDYGPEKLPPRTSDCTYLGMSVLCGPRGLNGDRDYFYRNDGNGRFSEVGDLVGADDPERYFGLGVLWSDLDADGDLDLVVANDATPNLFYVNEGGRFEEMGFLSGLAVSGDGNEQASMGVDSADYDNDGLLDVIFTHFASDYSTLYRNEGGLMFRDVTGEAQLEEPEWHLVSWGVRFLDLNLDGFKDILHSNGHVYPYLAEAGRSEKYAQSSSLYMNLGDGTFRDASQEAGSDFLEARISRGVAFADYDNDGDLDLVIANLDGEPQFFRNDRRDRNRWLMFRLEGVPMTDAVGARIRVVTEGLSQTWEVKRALGIYSASDPRAAFGVAQARTAAVEVTWMDGSRQSFDDVPTNRHYYLRQGSQLSEEERAP